MKFILFSVGALALWCSDASAYHRNEHCQTVDLFLSRAIAPRRAATHVMGTVLAIAKGGTQGWVSAYEGITPLPLPGQRPGDEEIFVMKILEDSPRTQVVYEERCWEGTKDLFRRKVQVIALSERLATFAGLQVGSEIELDCFESNLNFRPFECAP